MNPQLGVVAAEAREEIAFWPLAAGGYLYVQTESLLVFAVLILTIIPAAGSYLVLKQLREIVNSQTDISAGRKGTESEKATEQIEGIVGELENTGLESSTLLFGFNGIFGIIFYFDLVYRILIAGTPDLVAMGLFLIPLITIAMAVTPFIR